jgi:hypothetical protein
MSEQHRHRTKHSLREEKRNTSALFALWGSFWNPPEENCPKCGSAAVEYYDPFFFSPIRTIKGRRRIRCIGCRFIWRPSRKGRSLMERLGLKI